MIDDELGSATNTSAFMVDVDVADALRSLGNHGERALRLLEDAARALSDPAFFSAPFEVAQSCCRGALDSLLKLAGDEFPGPRSATANVVAVAKRVVDDWRATGDIQSSDLDGLGSAVDALIVEEVNPGSFRVRQIDHLVRERAQEGLGAAEWNAAGESWGSLYRDSSGVLHGGATGAQASVDLFGRIIEAIRQVFVGLPLRAARLRYLALSSAPTQEEADEVALMTDPRAGAYFLRTATSGEWLDLLPVERMLPEQSQWPARPYLQRLLADNPARTVKWLVDHLPALREIGPTAVTQAVGLFIDAGIDALPFMKRILNDQPQGIDIARRIAFWAQNVPGQERNRDWAGVIERVLEDAVFLDREEWEAGQLLEALVSTAYPTTGPALADAKLVQGIRYVLASVLDHRADPAGRSSALDTTWDLTATGNGIPSRFAHHAARAVLDLALLDAQHDVELEARLGPLRAKVRDARVTSRVVVVHLWETREAGTGDESRHWWSAAIAVAESVVGHPTYSKDSERFLKHLSEHCPADLLPQLITGLSNGLGPAPDQQQIEDWKDVSVNTRAALPLEWLPPWLLSRVLPEQALESWQPLLATLAEIAGGQPSEYFEQPWTVGGGTPSPLPVEQFVAQAEVDGAPAAMTALLSTHGEDYAAAILADAVRHLVETDPETWAREPDAVAAAAPSALQAAYFEALDDAIENSRLDRAEVGAKPIAAAFTAARTSRPADLELCTVACTLLHNAWARHVDLGEIEQEATQWLAGIVESWIQIRAAGESDPWYEVVGSLGGRALAALIAWGIDRARHADGQLPGELAELLDRILESSDDALALAVVGRYLADLFQHASGWAGEHAGRLLGTDGHEGPIRTWFTHGRPSGAILSRLDPGWLFGPPQWLDEDLHVDHIVTVLLDEDDALGTPRDVFTHLASSAGGGAAVSKVLATLARRLSGTAPQTLVDRVCHLWQDALNADLQNPALAGTGTFALISNLDDQRWLELTSATVEQTGTLDFADRVAIRAAEHPESPHALRIAAAVLSMQTDVYRAERVKAAARRLYLESGPGESPEHQALQQALINAGVVEAAFAVDDLHDQADDPTDS